MLHHCKAVRRGAPSRFVVGDLPFGSYESSPSIALDNAFKLVKEGEHTNNPTIYISSCQSLIKKLVE